MLLLGIKIFTVREKRQMCNFCLSKNLKKLILNWKFQNEFMWVF